jgi:hypothetical protein
MATKRRRTVKKESTVTEALHAGGDLYSAVQSFLFPASQGDFRNGELRGEHIERMRRAFMRYDRAFVEWTRKGRIVETYWKIRVYDPEKYYDIPEAHYNKLDAMIDVRSLRKLAAESGDRLEFKLVCFRKYARLRRVYTGKKHE